MQTKLQTTFIDVDVDDILEKYFNENDVYKINTSQWDSEQYKDCHEYLRNNNFASYDHKQKKSLYVTNKKQKPSTLSRFVEPYDASIHVYLNLIARSTLFQKGSVKTIFNGKNKTYPLLCQIVKMDEVKVNSRLIDIIIAYSYEFKMFQEQPFLHQSSFTMIRYVDCVKIFGLEKASKKTRFTYKSEDDFFESDNNGDWVVSGKSPKEKTLNSAYNMLNKEPCYRLEFLERFIRSFNKDFNQYFEKDIYFSSMEFDIFKNELDSSETINVSRETCYLNLTEDVFDTLSFEIKKQASSTVNKEKIKITQVKSVDEAKEKPLLLITYDPDYYKNNKKTDPKKEIYLQRKGLPTQTIYNTSLKKGKQSALNPCAWQLMLKQHCANKTIPLMYKMPLEPWLFKYIKHTKKYFKNENITKYYEEKYVLKGAGNKITTNKHYLSEISSTSFIGSLSWIEFNDLKIQKTQIRISPNSKNHLENHHQLLKNNLKNINDYRESLLKKAEGNEKMMPVVKAFNEVNPNQYISVEDFFNEMRKHGNIGYGTKCFKETMKSLNLYTSMDRTNKTDYCTAKTNVKVSRNKSYFSIGLSQSPNVEVATFNNLYYMRGSEKTKKIFINLILQECIKIGSTSVMSIMEKICLEKIDYKKTIKI